MLILINTNNIFVFKNNRLLSGTRTGAGGVSITHDYISGDLKNGHSNTEHDSTMEVKLNYSIDNLDR